MIKSIFKKIIAAILKFEARLILRKYKPNIVAVTGTVGKTSAKDAIALVLGQRFNVRKSEKSYNSELGVPLTIIGAPSAWGNFFQWILVLAKGFGMIFKKINYPRWLVLEMGVDRPGDMENMVSWIYPRAAVLTAFGDVPVHVEYFSGPEDVVKEKSKLIKVLANDAAAILNGDDKAIAEMKEKTRSRVITFGFAKENDLIASNYHITSDGVSFKAEYKGSIVPVRLRGVYGKQHVYSALAALAIGVSQEMNLVEMAESLSLYKSPPGRLNLIEGIKNSFILDDSYNSSPMALEAAMEVLKELPSQRKIAALGDMLELGKFTIDEHRRAGRMVREAGVESLFVVGPRAKFIAEEAKAVGFDEKNIFEFSTSVEAGEAIQKKIKEGDLILIKGSQSMRMEKITEEIMARPALKEQLLVRQEKEWSKR